MQDSDFGGNIFAKLLLPIILGIGIGLTVFLAYLIFFCTACCTCCKKDRSCCQQPQEKQYKQRVPFVVLVATFAIVGAIGGILVLSSGPNIIKIANKLIADLVGQVHSALLLEIAPMGYVVLVIIQTIAFTLQVDSILNALRTIITDTETAVNKARVSLDSTGGLEETLDTLETLRDNDFQLTADFVDLLGKLITPIAMAFGGILMGVALLGLCGAAFLVRTTSSQRHTCGLGGGT